VQLELIFLSELASDFVNLALVTHHQAEMLDPVWLEVLDLEDGHELMLSELAPGGSLAASQHFQAEDVRVEFDGFFGVGDLDDDMIATIDLYGHGHFLLSWPSAWRARMFPLR
jgi:hypothetical protein